MKLQKLVISGLVTGILFSFALTDTCLAKKKKKSEEIERPLTLNDVQNFSVQKIIDLGDEKYLVKDYAKSFEYYKLALDRAKLKTVRNDQLMVDILYKLNKIYLEQGNKPYFRFRDDTYYLESIRFGLECLEIQPSNWEVLTNLAFVYGKLGNYDSADKYYTEARKYLDPASFEYGQVEKQQGKIQHLKKLYERQKEKEEELSGN